MAYMSQDKKKEIAAELKTVLKGSGLKYSLGVHHHSTLCINIKQGPIDFIQNMIETMSQAHDVRSLERAAELRKNPPTHIQVNDYWFHEHFSGKALEVLKTIITVMNKGNHDNSDIRSDYFDVGWYLSVNIGKWDSPYQVVK